MFDSCPDILRVEDVCKLLLISRNSLYGLLKSGELKGFSAEAVPAELCSETAPADLSDKVDAIAREISAIGEEE